MPLENLIYHPENEGSAKTFRDLETNCWYYEYELLSLIGKQEVDNLKAKSNPKCNAFAVYPDSVKMDLSSKNTLMAIFRIEEHAKSFGYKMWNEFYIIKPIHCDFIDSE